MVYSGSPLFVTIKMSNNRGDLVQRGCMGCLTPLAIHQGLWDYARTRCADHGHSRRPHSWPCLTTGCGACGSSFKDKRYKPLAIVELEKLHVQVSLLSCYEKLGPGSWNQWEVGTHGITIEFEVGGRRFTSTYLPQIPVEEGTCHVPELTPTQL